MTSTMIKSCANRFLRLSLTLSKQLPSCSVISLNGMQNDMCGSRFFGHLSDPKCVNYRLYTQRKVSHSAMSLAQNQNYCSSANVAAVEDIDTLFPLRFIYVRTSVDRWHETPEGIMFDVGYVDSMLGQPYSARVPVILGLPSVVGNHKELAKFLLVYAKLGYRVIIPNMPGSLLCRGRSKSDLAYFSFTLEEKADFVKDFLEELSIPKVDVLVTSSCSVYTGTQLCVHHTNMFRSLAMINPTGLQPTKAMEPTLFHINVANVWDQQYFLHPVMDLTVYLGKLFTKKRHWPVSNIVTFSRNVASYVNAYDDIRQNADDLHRHRTIPMLAIYQDNHADLDVTSTQEILELMGIQKANVTMYDRNGTVVASGSPKQQQSGMHFQGETGAFTDAQTTLIKKRLWEFFKFVRPDL